MAVLANGTANIIVKAVGVLVVLAVVTGCDPSNRDSNDVGFPTDNDLSEAPQPTVPMIVVVLRVPGGAGYESEVSVTIPGKEALSRLVDEPLKEARYPSEYPATIIYGNMEVHNREGDDAIVRYDLESPWGGMSNPDGDYMVADLSELRTEIRKCLRRLMDYELYIE